MIRTLTVEALGQMRRDKKRFPRIRIGGFWLASVGFPPSSRVEVEAIAEGVIVLRSVRAGGGN